MTAKNDHTGDWLQTKPSTDQYRENDSKIFMSKEEQIAMLKSEVKRLQEVISELRNNHV